MTASSERPFDWEKEVFRLRAHIFAALDYLDGRGTPSLAKRSLLIAVNPDAPWGESDEAAPRVVDEAAVEAWIVEMVDTWTDCEKGEALLRKDIARLLMIARGRERPKAEENACTTPSAPSVATSAATPSESTQASPDATSDARRTAASTAPGSTGSDLPRSGGAIEGSHEGPDASPSCSRCGGSRLIRNGKPAQCSYVKCHSPLYDYERETGSKMLGENPEQASRVEVAIDAARGLLRYLECTGKDQGLSPSHDRHVRTLRGGLNALEQGTAYAEPDATHAGPLLELARRFLMGVPEDRWGEELSADVAALLHQVRRETIETCAKICDGYGREGDRLAREFANETADELASRMRAMLRNGEMS